MAVVDGRVCEALRGAKNVILEPFERKKPVELHGHYMALCICKP
jgi:hypothetical protein